MPFGNSMRFGCAGWNAGSLGIEICFQVCWELCWACARNCPVLPINATKTRSTAQENPAREGRSRLAQRFSAGKNGKNDSSPGGTTEAAAESCFVSGYRFSDTANPSKPVAPLGAVRARFTVHLLAVA